MWERVVWEASLTPIRRIASALGLGEASHNSSSASERPPTDRWRQVSRVGAAFGKVYQWCRPAPAARVNLCVADNPNAAIAAAGNVKMCLGRGELGGYNRQDQYKLTGGVGGQGTGDRDPIDDCTKNEPCRVF